MTRPIGTTLTSTALVPRRRMGTVADVSGATSNPAFVNVFLSTDQTGTVLVPCILTEGCDPAVNDQLMMLEVGGDYCAVGVIKTTIGKGRAMLLQTSAQGATTNNVWTDIVFNGEVWDEENAHSTVTNNNRYTCQHDGWYAVSGVVAFAANGTGTRGVRIMKNGGNIQGSASTSSSSGTTNVTSVASALIFVQCVATDWIGLQGIQLSGGGLATAVQADNSCSMVVWREKRL